jgi:hypothetical protein
VPVIVRGLVPVGVFLLVLIVSVELLPLPDTGFGLKLPELLDGSPLTFRLTLPENPYIRVMVTV